MIHAIDAAFRNVGIAHGTIGDSVVITRLDLIKNRKRKGRVSFNDFDDARIIYNFLQSLEGQIVFELPTGSQSSRASKLLGMISGVMACTNGIPITPHQVKTVVENETGILKPKKDDIVAWARKNHPDLNWNDFNKGDWEHLADAIAVMYAYKLTQ